MKIVVHDYAGHPFQTQLSRELARRGNEVFHLYFFGDEGPKGDMVDVHYQRGYVSFVGLSINGEYSKSNFFKRLGQDLEYRRVLSAKLKELDYDIVISGNTPTWVQGALLSAARLRGARFCYWCQDFYSIAVTSILKQKFGVLGSIAGKVVQRLDRAHFRAADHVVHITEAFCEVTKRWGVDEAKVSVIPNWGALDDIDVLPKNSGWARANGLSGDKFRVVYSGTLALKHNPEYLTLLAEVSPNIEVLAVAFGVGADELKMSQEKLENLRVLPPQPFSEFPEVLACADVLVAVIEEDAGQYSVPSKVLSYLCAGRPIVLSSPRTNLAARIVKNANAGVVVDSGDKNAFIAAVDFLRENEDIRDELGRNGRMYAEQNFDIGVVADRFAAACSMAGEL